MAFPSSRLTEIPLRRSIPLTSRSCYYSYPCLHSFLLFSSCPKLSFPILRAYSSLRTSEQPSPGNRSARTSDHQGPKPSAPWLAKWPSGGPVVKNASEDNERVEMQREGPGLGTDYDAKLRYLVKDKGQSAIERIVLRLRNLGLGTDDEDEDEEDIMEGGNLTPVTAEERLGDLLRREWVRPDMMLEEREGSNEDKTLLPWEKDDDGFEERINEGGVLKKARIKAPTLAELTIEDSELRRLRRNGMYLRERINIPKAGLTQAVMEKMHDKWRKEELVRLKFHEVLARDMKTAHEIVERRTGGLVIWRSGSVMVVYRGSNYEGPSSGSQAIDEARESNFVPDVSSAGVADSTTEDAANLIQRTNESTVKTVNHAESMTAEEAEFNNLLDSLGPRFHEWWGTGVIPVDADLLPSKIPGYKTPFRLVPAGMRSRLTNAEMTDLRKIAKSLPCHFALGRNRNHQGLASAIIRLWEKSLIVKIAVKRGIQNTNNKLMADELKTLTGGTLLLRNKYYIVMYRGKDFLPPSVAATLAERQDLTKEIQDAEEKVRNQGVEAVQPVMDNIPAQAGTLAEFYEAQARWGREMSPDECQKMIQEASRAEHARAVKRIEHKLEIAQAKKLRSEKLLSKIEASMIPGGPDHDQETITDEERVMFRRVGLRMKPYLPLGIRGVFDGVVENMHLHWKHRELVKLITKQKNLAFVEDTARLLEYESGGILVAIESVSKGYALIYYRGKNYQRPVSLRPRNLLTKAKALKRSVAMQRHEALSQHISELQRTIEQMKTQLTEKEPSCEDGLSENDDNNDEDTDFEALRFSYIQP